MYLAEDIDTAFHNVHCVLSAVNTNGSCCHKAEEAPCGYAFILTRAKLTRCICTLFALCTRKAKASSKEMNVGYRSIERPQ